MVFVAAVVTLGTAGGSVSQEVAEPQPPNILFVVTDDMRADDLAYLTRLRARTSEKGVTFGNAFVTNSLCCPSRATLLTGRYSHNHLVFTNRKPLGGYGRFVMSGGEGENIAVRLDAEGYRTGFFGKYIHAYPGKDAPPGWDQWYALRGNGPDMFVNGTAVNYPDDTFIDDVLGVKAAGFVRSTPDHSPLFVSLWLHSPHFPVISPARYASAHDATELTVPGSYDEADISDKPQWVREWLPFTEEVKLRVTEQRRARLEMLEGATDALSRVINMLRLEGRLENTYIVFTSDNGSHFGEHKLTVTKQTAFDEAVRMPLIIQGPGIPAGKTRDELVLNNDLAPTIADLAEAELPSSADGRSLKPLLLDPGGEVPWREAFLIEHWRAEDGVGGDLIPTYSAIRTQSRLYVEYQTDEKELYDISEDPHQLQNIAGDPARGAEEAALKNRLEALKGCAAATCLTAEGP